MTTWAMVFLILGCAVVTWLPRILPFVLVKNMTLPDVVLRWLSYIPICILTALVAESLFHAQSGKVEIEWLNVSALIPTLIVALWTKSLSITVIVGVISMAVLRFIF